MPDFSMSNLAVAFSITLAAGLFTVLGSGLVMFSKNRPIRACCRLVWHLPVVRWCMFP